MYITLLSHYLNPNRSSIEVIGLKWKRIGYMWAMLFSCYILSLQQHTLVSSYSGTASITCKQSNDNQQHSSAAEYLIRKQSFSVCNLYLSGDLAGDKNPRCKTISGKTGGNAIKQSARIHGQARPSNKMRFVLDDNVQNADTSVQHIATIFLTTTCTYGNTRCSPKREHSSKPSQILVINSCNYLKPSKILDSHMSSFHSNAPWFLSPEYRSLMTPSQTPTIFSRFYV